MMRYLTSSKFFFIFGLFLCIPIIIPYLHSGYFPSHDGEWAVVRAGEMFRELRDLQFPPRYSGALNFGYGYPLFNFAYPLPYYITTFLHIFKFGFINSVKILFVGSVFFSFAGMFFFSKYFWKNSLAGFISGMLYIYLPYRLVDLYVRGSIGESLAFVLYPLILMSALYVVNSKKKYTGIILLTILFGVIILTHNISALYLGFILLGFIISLFASQKYRDAFFILGSLIWGVLMSSFFVVPALLEKHFVKISIIPIADRNLYYVSFSKLLNSSWGYGTPTDQNSFTYQLGIPQLLGFLTSFYMLNKGKNTLERNIILAFIFLSVFFLFMMFPISTFVWKLPLLSDINYPWTLLLPVGFLFCFLSGGVSKIKVSYIVGVTLIVLSVFLYISYAKPEAFNKKDDMYYLTNEATTTSSNEFMPLWVKKEPTNRFARKIEGTKYSNLKYTSNEIFFKVDNNQAKHVTLSQIYYPGWKAYIDKQEIPITYNNNLGVITINIPQGIHSIQVKFTETSLRLLFDLISLLAVVTLLIYGSVNMYIKYYGKKK